MAYRIMFVVQGEGRGHLTQALALKAILHDAGHTVCAVVVGISKYRQIPKFFFTQIDCKVVTIYSPNLKTAKDIKGIRPAASVLETIMHLKTYRRSLRTLNQVIGTSAPNLIINFYEPLVGLNGFLRKYKVPVWSIAHQFLLLHPKFKFPEEKKWSQYLLRTLTKLVANGSSKKIALSFYPFDHGEEIIVMPPLLRPEVYKMQSTHDDFFLIYLLNKGYIGEIVDFHRKNPSIKLHCFTDSTDIPEEWIIDETLIFHRLNGQLYLELMASCQALITTAGFESVCEALYFGKPVLMVPVQNHIEQYINSRDAMNAHAGMHAERFDLGSFLSWLPQYVGPDYDYVHWASQFKTKFIRMLETSLNQKYKL